VRIVDPKDALIVVDNDGDELWFYDAAGAVAVATAPRDQRLAATPWCSMKARRAKPWPSSRQ